MTAAKLETAARNAGRRGETWGEFWERHATDAAKVEPWNLKRRRRLARRLLTLLMQSRPTPRAPWDIEE